MTLHSALDTLLVDLLPLRAEYQAAIDAQDAALRAAHGYDESAWDAFTAARDAKNIALDALFTEARKVVGSGNSVNDPIEVALAAWAVART